MIFKKNWKGFVGTFSRSYVRRRGGFSSTTVSFQKGDNNWFFLRVECSGKRILLFCRRISIVNGQRRVLCQAFPIWFLILDASHCSSKIFSKTCHCRLFVYYQSKLYGNRNRKSVFVFVSGSRTFDEAGHERVRIILIDSHRGIK